MATILFDHPNTRTILIVVISFFVLQCKYKNTFHHSGHIVSTIDTDTLINTISFPSSENGKDILGGPYQIKTNSRHIYIIDNAFAHIKKYNIEGRLISKIGGRGRGPGEFLNINHIYIDHDRIIAFDEYLMRFTTFDAATQNVVDTKPNSGDMLWVRDIYLDNTYGNIIMLYAPDVTLMIEQDLHVIHEYECFTCSELIKKGSLIEVKSLYPDIYHTDIAQNILAFNAGYIERSGSDYIYFPHIFNGKLYRFSGDWVITDTLKTPFQLEHVLTSLNRSVDDIPKHAIVSSGVRASAGIIHSEIIGTAICPNSNIVFAQLLEKNDTEKVLILNIIDSDTNVIKSTIIKDMDPIDISINFSYLSLQDIDQDYNAYFIDNRNGDSKVLRKNIAHLFNSLNF